MPAVSHALEGDGGPFGGPFGGVSLPPGTYGARQTASGRTVGTPIVFGYERKSYPLPRLPRVVPVDHLITVGAQRGGGRFRVLAVPSPDVSARTIVAVPLREMDQTLSRLRLVEALVIGGVLLVLGLGVRRRRAPRSAPARAHGQTADDIAAGNLGRRVRAGHREDGGRPGLGLALNAMLARLEHAFAQRRASEERLRVFVADASHELRTPLASIRGYAELFGMGAVEDPDELRKTMRRIEDEAKRMGVLVEDLLTLARLDEVREDQSVEVDLAEISRDSAADARATAPDRRIEVSGPRGAGRRPRRHPDRLRQVLGNLLRNALVHTPDGTPIDVDVRRADAEVTIVVRDYGPGLPGGEAEAPFERFWRAEAGGERGGAAPGSAWRSWPRSSRPTTAASTASNAPGGGARFEVRLPSGPSKEVPTTIPPQRGKVEA